MQDAIDQDSGDEPQHNTLLPNASSPTLSMTGVDVAADAVHGDVMTPGNAAVLIPVCSARNHSYEKIALEPLPELHEVRSEIEQSYPPLGQDLSITMRTIAVIGAASPT